jgi:alpha-galactosidase
VGQCLPAGSKAINIGAGPDAASVSFTGVTAKTAGTKLVDLDFVNYGIAWETSWKRPQGTSARNVTVSVNGAAAQLYTLPISGSNWFDSGRLTLDLPGFVAGDNNTVVFKAVTGLVSMAPDIVGFQLRE